MSGVTPPSEVRPTRASALLSGALAVALSAALVWTAGVAATFLLGVLGAACLVLALWTTRWERHRPVGALLASLLALPVGVGLLSVTAGTYLVLAAEAFPVGDDESVRAVTMTVVLTVALVTAAAGAVFGALSGYRSVLGRRSTARAGRRVARTAVVPLVPAGLVGLVAGLGYLASSGLPPWQVQLLATADAYVLAPPVATPHPATLAGLVGVAAIALSRAVEALPIAELTAGDEIGDGGGVDWAAGTERAARWLFRGGVASLVAALPLGAYEVFAPWGVPDGIAPLLAATELRWPLVGLALLAALVVGVVHLLRWLVHVEVTRTALAPLAGGGIVLVGALPVAEPVLTHAVAWTVSRLPEPFDDVGRSIADGVIDVYGHHVIVLLALGAILLAVAGVLGLLWLAARGGVVDRATASGRVAGTGLFLAAACGAALSVPAPLVLAGVAGGLVVADLDAFASTLGREVGRRADTTTVEVLHGLGAVVVAASGVVVAAGAGALALEPVATDATALTFGLLAGVAAVLALLATLR